MSPASKLRPQVTIPDVGIADRRHNYSPFSVFLAIVFGRTIQLTHLGLRRKSFKSAMDLDKKVAIEADAGNEISYELEGEIINASGHRDQLQRGYGFLSLCGLALTIDSAWIAVGLTFVVAIGNTYSLQVFCTKDALTRPNLANGGAPGIIYELLVACFYYAFIGASLAELASSVPSAGGVYSWASITPGPRAGRIIGFYAGLINFFGWLFDLASIGYVCGEILTEMYALYHPNYEVKQWHVFVGMLCTLWSGIAATIFFNKFLPYFQHFGLFMITMGGIVTIVVIAAMPDQHASNASVWKDFENNTGWSDGVAFMAGVLNGAFTIGTPDSASHMAEELPNPRKDIPHVIAMQIGLGCLYAFAFVVACFYGVNDFNAVLNSNGSFPLAQIYIQATGSTGATFSLLLIIILCTISSLVATILTVSRTWWSLARDKATPFPRFFAYVNEDLSCPIPATVFVGLLATAFGALAIGSHTAFSDLVGSFVILTTVSYAMAFIPHMLSKRKNVPRGYFWMGSLGYFVNGFACLTMILFNVFFCLPYALPTTVEAMNYNSVIFVGVVALITLWWFGYASRHYERPKVALLYDNLSITEGRRVSKV